MVRHDLFVIGGGPAGLVTAIAARMAGLTVSLADMRRPPVDKACGEGIMPDGVAILRELGVVLPSEKVYPFRGIRYVQGALEAEARFGQDRAGLGVRRTVLEEALIRRAVELGVTFAWGRRVNGLHPEGVVLDGSPVAARWVAAADGQDSRIRRSLGLDAPVISRRVGVRRHVNVAPWTDTVEVHWADGCEIYATPVSPQEICIAALAGDPWLGLDRALERFPAVCARIAGAAATTKDLGAPTLFRKARGVTSGRVALVGDAAGCVDAITGAGVSLALHQAVALAEALRHGDLRRYERDYRRIARVAVGMTRFMLAIHERPRLRRWALMSLSAVPAVFRQLLAIHIRAHPFFTLHHEPLAAVPAQGRG